MSKMYTCEEVAERYSVSKTVRLQMHYKKTFDRIRIGDTLYKVDFERKLRTKHVFVVSEVQ